jgi:hypothetical protein
VHKAREWRGEGSRAWGLFAALVLIAGCSSGAASSGASAATTVAPRQVAADHARAVAAVLRASDLPAGWTATPHTSGPGVPGLDKALADCLGVSVGLLNGNDPTNADSPDFSNANGGEIANSVGYEATVGRVHQLSALLQSVKMAPCLNSSIKAFLDYRLSHPASPSQSVPAGISLGRPATTRLGFPATGDVTVAYRFVVPVEGAGTPISVFGDFVFAAKGRAGAVLTVESQGAAPDQALEQRLVRTVAGRLSSG